MKFSAKHKNLIRSPFSIRFRKKFINFPNLNFLEINLKLFFSQIHLNERRDNSEYYTSLFNVK